jgi:hypothetical protein
MTSIVQDIQLVRSLRKDLREVRIPTNILASIETIHNCIKSGTDLNGWKKVEWRGGNSNSRNASSGPRTGTNNGQGFNRSSTNNNGSNNNFFNSRPESNTSSSSHYAFGKPKGGFTGRQINETPTSIPLTSGNTTNVTQSSPTTNVSPDGFRTMPNKYVSKFKKNSEKVEDTILNTILLGKLNKFSEQNYDEIKEFITHIIDSGQTDMIKCFMKLVFEKAASEEMFCPLYAKLLSELSARYPVLLTEMTNLYSVYMAIFEEIVETNAENYNEVCKRNIEKKYRRGYSQFLAELIKHNVIDTDIFLKTITTIITQIENNINNKESSKVNEEYADCLVRIMRAIEQDNSEDDNDDFILDSDSDDEDKNNKTKVIVIRNTIKETIAPKIQPLTLRNSENLGITNKARFTFLDIYEGIQKF